MRVAGNTVKRTVLQVCTKDGQTYERAAIEDWLRSHEESPVTGARLSSKALV